MFETHTNKQKASHLLGDIIHRAAFPFVLFSAVLLGLLLLSWYLLLPRFTHVEVGGTMRDIHTMKTYREELIEQIAEVEGKRNGFLLPVRDSLYTVLKEEKTQTLDFLSLRRVLLQAADTLLPDTKNVVGIRTVSYDVQEGVVELVGRIQNVGPRSMTVLAQFVEALEDLSVVASIEHSRYTREEDQNSDFYSPFTLRLLLP